MKLTKSKQFLADAIHASGKGWPDGANWAVQVSRPPEIFFASGRDKPVRSGNGYRVKSGGLFQLDSAIKCDKLSPNWHQTILSRDEYFIAYPEEPVADVDGWIEWLSDELPVAKGTIIDVKYSDGDELHGAPCGVKTENLISIRGDGAGAELFGHSDFGAYIIAYRLHKPEVKPDFCESVMRSIPEPEAKPSIEQLAADYRNANDYAERKQKEADAAKADAEAKLALLVDAGKAHGLSVSPITEKQEPELVITDWRDWAAGDLVELVKFQGGSAKVGEIGEISTVFDGGTFHVDFPSQFGYLVDHQDVKFISRP